MERTRYAYTLYILTDLYIYILVIILYTYTLYARGLVDIREDSHVFLLCPFFFIKGN